MDLTIGRYLSRRMLPLCVSQRALTSASSVEPWFNKIAILPIVVFISAIALLSCTSPQKDDQNAAHDKGPKTSYGQAVQAGRDLQKKAIQRNQALEDAAEVDEGE